MGLHMGCPRGYPMAYYMLETALPLSYPMAYPWHTLGIPSPENSLLLAHPGIPNSRESPYTCPTLGEGGEAAHRLGLGRAGWDHPL